MTSNTEKHIIRALEDIQNGLSQRKASERWGIPRSTLRGRLNGSQNVNDANEWRKRLSNEQETHLVGWIFIQEAIGFPVTHQQVREFAERVLKASGNTQPLGKGWIEGFLYRNPKVRTKRGKTIDSKRANGATIK